MHKFGPIVNVEHQKPPYGNTRRLITDFDVGGDTGRAHSAVQPGKRAKQNSDGSLAHDEVWRYLFTHPVENVGMPVPMDDDCRQKPTLMISSESNSSDTPRATELPKPQFNLRAFWYVSILVGISSVLLGPYIREWNNEQRFYFLLVVVTEILLLIGIVLLVLRNRKKTLQNAGTCYFRTSYLDQQAKSNSHSFLAILRKEMWALFPILTQLAFVLWWSTHIIQTGASYFLLLTGFVHVSGLYFGIARFCGIAWGTNDRDYEFCENGFTVGALYYTPWKVISDIRPSETHKDRLILVLRTGENPKSLQATQVLPAASKQDRDDLLHLLKDGVERYAKE